LLKDKFIISTSHDVLTFTSKFHYEGQYLVEVFFDGQNLL
jgi:hypothetical protein